MIRFTKDECQEIINLSKSIKGTRRDESPRPISYDFYSIGYSSETKWIFDKLDRYFTETTGISVLKPLDAVHLFDYSVGDKFGKHRDIYYQNQIHNIGVCLNDDYEGGEFVLYDPQYTVLPKITGEIYTFNHSYEHEVMEVTNGHRWSLIGFYFYDHLDLKKPLL
jgi:hypothetical protein